MAGNIIIVTIVVTDQHFHTPMYFFLGNLSCLETCYTSTILPRMLASLLTGDRNISTHLMANTEGRNQTSISEFILLGFGNLPELQLLLFLLFLVIYMVTVAGNILIVALVVTDQHLHTPMYFFLGNLSCLETCYSSSILPRMLASLLTGDRTISAKGLQTQQDKKAPSYRSPFLPKTSQDFQKFNQRDC
ncbi:olfactory receptor 5V1-like isoform X3 [Mauremys mutica]|uniref:olfactory receptor 5V1-like isoform X3 n=1 Tax=Mauremys mutica TaxID=74926 RepID=UPI001D16D202|nr:olfactory receptor 5V1-like isoform X3 [Mauremys mutica]